MVRFLILILLAIIVGGTSYAERKVSKEFVWSPYNLAWLFGEKLKPLEGKPERELCETKECKNFAKMLLDNMDKSVAPCDDFYEYACGKWKENNPIPENKIAWNMWGQLQERIKAQMNEILRGGSEPGELLLVKLAKRWHKSCTDIDRIEKRGVEPLVSTMARAGGWPLTMEADEWEERKFEWQRIDDYYARLFGGTVFYRTSVVQSSTNENEKYIIIGKPHMPIDSALLWKEENNEVNIDPRDGRNGSKEGNQELDSEEPGDEEEANWEQDSDQYIDTENDESSEPPEKGGSESNGEIGGEEKHEGEQNDNDEIHCDDELNDNNEKNDDNTAGDDREDDNNSEEDDGHEDKTIDNDEIVKKKFKKNKKLIAKVTRNRLGHKKLRNGWPEISKAGSGYERLRKDKTEVDNKGMKHRSSRNEKNNARKRTSRVKRSGKKRMTNGKVQHGYVKNERTYGQVMKEHHTKSSKREIQRKFEKLDTLTIMKKLKEGQVPQVECMTEKNSEETDTSNEEGLSLRDRYIRYITVAATEVAEARGADVDIEKLGQDIEDMFIFQMKLMEITLVESNSTAPRMTLKSFQEWYDSLEARSSNSQVNWMAKIKGLFSEANVFIDNSAVVYIDNLEYFEHLHDLLERTPTRTIANYIHWNFLNRLLRTSTKKLRRLSFSWRTDHKEESLDERCDRCMTEVEMSDILPYVYIRKYFSDDSEKTATDMIDDIQKEVEYQAKDSKWLDDDTKDFVLGKLVEMHKLVGCPDWYRNDTAVKLYFRGLTVGRSYYENSLSYMRYFKRRELQRFVHNEGPESWVIRPTSLDAFFAPNYNSITITAANFQSPFFAYDRPSAINYGIVGFVIAHEVNHGFDDRGRLYDRHGEETEWLTAMANAYSKRAECFVDQFNGYDHEKEAELKIQGHGNQTLDENIADTMGLQAVFRAYQRRQRQCQTADPALPGLEDISNEQLLFLSFANLWCESVNPKFALNATDGNAHTTGRHRVIGSVSNSQDFAASFNCPTGSPMNPGRKCNIWK